MNKHIRLLALALTLMLCIGLVAGCAGTPAQTPADATAAPNAPADPAAPAAPEKTEYRELYSNEVTTLNYLVTGNANDLKVCVNVVDGLVEYDTYGIIKPALAESWSVSPDGLTWTFKIREGVSWVDSTGAKVADVTAEDWVSSAKYVLDAKNESTTEYMFEGIVKNAAQYYGKTYAELLVANGDYATIEEAYAVEGIEPTTIDFSEVGVKAVDKYTLEFTLEAPKPFFLSVLSYGGYFPAYGPQLEEKGTAFGTDKDSLLFNGAYILSEFEPQVKRVLVKNPEYWDKDNVFIEKLAYTYNAEATALEPEMFKRGELEYARISADILDDWTSNPETMNLVRSSPVDNSYSYFYTFNFNPQFDAQYEPDNWKKAVNNENFRLSIQAGLDRLLALSIKEPYEPKLLLNNTVTPANFAAAGGKDYVTYPDLAPFTNGDTFNEAKALEYKAAAVTELTAAGATFPVKILMPYNPASTADINWVKECQVVEQQLEGLLGTDYIDIIIEAGPSTGFLGAVRRTGMFALMKCNWGADFADPETWAQPFLEDNTYNFMDKSEDAKTAAAVQEYYALIDAAVAITNDDAARYTAFAKAEAYLLSHAVIIPFSVDSFGYVATVLDPFDSQYAPYGMTLYRFKGRHLQAEPMGLEAFPAAYETWKADRAAALAAAE